MMQKENKDSILNRLIRFFFVRDLNKTTPFRRFLQKYIWLFYLTVRDFITNMCPVHSGSLAYVTTLSMIPMAVLVFSIAGLYGLGELVINYTENNIFPYLIPEMHQQLSSWLESNISRDAFRLSGNTGLVNIIAIAGLIFAGTAILVISERVFNEIWRVKKGGSYFRKITGFWIFFTVSPLLILGNTIVKNLFMPAGGFMDLMIQNNPFFRFSYNRLLPFLITLMIMVMINMVIPRAKVLFKSALFGGAVSALLWELSKNFFYLYVNRMTNITNFYGSLSTIPVFMIWMYLTWMIILFGAELSYTFQNRKLLTNLYRGYSKGGSQYTHAYLGVALLIWMNSFYRRGKSIPALDKFCDFLGVRLTTMSDVGEELVQLEYLDPVRAELPRYVFAQNPEFIELDKVIDAMLRIEFSSEYNIHGTKAPTEQHYSTDSLFIEAQKSFLKPFKNKVVSEFNNL